MKWHPTNALSVEGISYSMKGYGLAIVVTGNQDMRTAHTVNKKVAGSLPADLGSNQEKLPTSQKGSLTFPVGVTPVRVTKIGS